MKLPLGCGRVLIKANFAIRLLSFATCIYTYLCLFVSLHLPLFVALFLFSSFIRLFFVILLTPFFHHFTLPRCYHCFCLLWLSSFCFPISTKSFLFHCNAPFHCRNIFFFHRENVLNYQNNKLINSWKVRDSRNQKKYKTWYIKMSNETYLLNYKQFKFALNKARQRQNEIAVWRR